MSCANGFHFKPKMACIFFVLMSGYFLLLGLLGFQREWECMREAGPRRRVRPRVSRAAAEVLRRLALRPHLAQPSLDSGRRSSCATPRRFAAYPLDREEQAAPGSWDRSGERA